MKVFLSWSGEKSRAVAEALREWLPYINSEIQPWMSGIDIEPGARWSNAIAEELDATSFGIVCVTRDNQSSPWLNFEAGALAKKLDTSRVVPLAIDLKPSDVKQPLGQFEVKQMTEAGILRVVTLLDELCDHHVPDVAKACTRNWPDLAPKLEAASASGDEKPIRDEKDLLEEILTTVRGLAVQARAPASSWWLPMAEHYRPRVLSSPLRVGIDPNLLLPAVGSMLPPDATATIVSTSAGQALLITAPTAIPQDLIERLTQIANTAGYLLMVGEPPAGFGT